MTEKTEPDGLINGRIEMRGSPEARFVPLDRLPQIATALRQSAEKVRTEVDLPRIGRRLENLLCSIGSTLVVEANADGRSQRTRDFSGSRVRTCRPEENFLRGRPLPEIHEGHPPMEPDDFRLPTVQLPVSLIEAVGVFPAAIRIGPFGGESIAEARHVGNCQSGPEEDATGKDRSSDELAPAAKVVESESSQKKTGRKEQQQRDESREKKSEDIHQFGRADSTSEERNDACFRASHRSNRSAKTMAT